jgi:hypothetical protein
MRLDEFFDSHPFDAVEFYRTKSDSLYEALKRATLAENTPSLTHKRKKKKKKKKKLNSASPDQATDHKFGSDPFFGFCPIHRCDFRFSEERSHDLSELQMLKRFLPDPIIKIITGYADFYELDLSPVRQKPLVDSNFGDLQTDHYSIKTRNLHRFLGVLIKVFYENHKIYENYSYSPTAPLLIRSLLDPKTGEISPQAFSDYFVGRLGHNMCLSINFGSDFITCSEERFCSCNVCTLDDLQILFSDVFGKRVLVSDGTFSLRLPSAMDRAYVSPFDRSFLPWNDRNTIYADQPYGAIKFKLPIHFDSSIYWIDLGPKILSKHPKVQSINVLSIGINYLSFEYDNNGFTKEFRIPSTIYFSLEDFSSEN